MGKRWKIEKKPEWSDFTHWKCYIEGALRKKQFTASFAPRLKWMACTHGIWAGSDKLKSINRIHEFPLWKCYIQDVPQKKNNIPISLVEHLEFPEWINFIHAILVGSDWWKSANRIQYSFHCLVTTYRVIDKRSNIATFIVESFQNEWVLSIEYR